MGIKKHEEKVQKYGRAIFLHFSLLLLYTVLYPSTTLGTEAAIQELQSGTL